MPRPIDVAGKRLEAFERRYALDQEKYPAGLRNDPRIKEVMLASYWLRDTLESDAVRAPLVQSICFAFGQIAAHSEDPWHAAARVVADTRQGNPPVPGPALAETLLQPLDVNALLEHFLKMRISPLALDRMADRFRQERHYQAEEEPEEEPSRSLYGQLDRMPKIPNTVVENLVNEYRTRYEAQYGPEPGTRPG